MLLHDAAVAGVAVEPWRLYVTHDLDYIQWLEAAVDQVVGTRRKQAEAAKNG